MCIRDRNEEEILKIKENFLQEIQSKDKIIQELNQTIQKQANQASDQIASQMEDARKKIEQYEEEIRALKEKNKKDIEQRDEELKKKSKEIEELNLKSESLAVNSAQIEQLKQEIIKLQQNHKKELERRDKEWHEIAVKNQENIQRLNQELKSQEANSQKQIEVIQKETISLREHYEKEIEWRDQVIQELNTVIQRLNDQKSLENSLFLVNEEQKAEAKPRLANPFQKRLDKINTEIKNHHEKIEILEKKLKELKELRVGNNSGLIEDHTKQALTMRNELLTSKSHIRQLELEREELESVCKN
eukprot:TRINITY_DN2924_c0_g2_i3.p1 TRINITY_DN2924_c0_g2~~TRINITY_DN2924_c0_g2_i3.p1  ORF type:complete len:314 (+),score=80.78 TRINITY_DN2924_c0_g2_i3:36-944(+)